MASRRIYEEGARTPIRYRQTTQLTKAGGILTQQRGAEKVSGGEGYRPINELLGSVLETESTQEGII